MRSVRGAGILSATLLCALTAGTATDPALKCEAGKNGAIGKYSSCLHKAQQRFLKGGETDVAGYAAAVATCSTKLSEKWTALESSGACPGPLSEMQDFADSCAASLVGALGGSDPGLDPSTCNASLSGCEEDLATCEDAAVCGNSRVDAGEACDAAGNSSTCDYDCTLPACGDGVVNLAAGEQCEDGNEFEGDGCSSCLIEVVGCGNGRLECGEGCDDGNLDNGDGCSEFCGLEYAAPECGNFITEFPEECDDGNLNPGDGCDGSCHVESGP